MMSLHRSSRHDRHKSGEPCCVSSHVSASTDHHFIETLLPVCYGGQIMAVAIVVLTLAASVMPVSAHHSVPGTFDVSQEFTIRGAVTKIEWTNPHGRFWVDARNADGTVDQVTVDLWR